MLALDKRIMLCNSIGLQFQFRRRLMIKLIKCEIKWLILFHLSFNVTWQNCFKSIMEDERYQLINTEYAMNIQLSSLSLRSKLYTTDKQWTEFCFKFTAFSIIFTLIYKFQKLHLLIQLNFIRLNDITKN